MAHVSEFMDVMSQSITNIKKVETTLPIARKAATCTPLVVGDDLALRSSLTSPATYDRDILGLLYNHSSILDENDKKTSYEQFVNQISNVDKLSLMWGLYKATYDSLGEDRTIFCKNKQCGKDFKDTIYLDDLVHDDTYTPWDKTNEAGELIPFTDYRFPIKEEKDGWVYEFATKLPSMADNNQMLGILSIDTLQHNLDTINQVFTKPQYMTLLTDAIRVTTPDGKVVETQNINEILMTMQRYVPQTIGDSFFEKYQEHFQYQPKFYKPLTCPVCRHEFIYEVDLEVEFFRRSILGQ